MGLKGSKYDRTHPTFDATWNSVEVVEEVMVGLIVVKSLAVPEKRKRTTVRLLLEEYKRRLGEA
jgi:hypothetical protein